jgi:hypothetical protein
MHAVIQSEPTRDVDDLAEQVGNQRPRRADILKLDGLLQIGIVFERRSGGENFLHPRFRRADGGFRFLAAENAFENSSCCLAHDQDR